MGHSSIWGFVVKSIKLVVQFYFICVQGCISTWFNTVKILFYLLSGLKKLGPMSNLSLDNDRKG